ncbi:hypothetical protein DICPUDRAFT_148690 [Dictyostelium purpureum]|uniref:Uncharacterized protein n=1 Tax=Dictyostelium purpureum TaxID=5786 RepID=F0ZBR5_DICPU|nr:uncharacterized protein DICPUDRAFT_148690 [Dictyostelium purpureum]EGC38580.1 hypothetical protein DICPUDRAFT_148690 [Dictyostelium purpureum]|eukprot:XP_003284859.1 hypothetical protein DICPUDRAFT_148690 [Dictyostelium purpureum]
MKIINIFRSECEYETYALISLIVGITLSIVCGVFNNDWHVFPSTISTLNSEFSDPSGRIFFGALLMAGILLLKSKNSEKKLPFKAINTLGTICILGIALFPTAQSSDIGNINKNIMISIHSTFAIILFFIIPLYKIIKSNSKSKRASFEHLKEINLCLLLSLVSFIGFIICQAIIWFQDTNDILRVPGSTPLEGKDYWILTHVLSFCFEILCVISVFIEYIIHVYEEYKLLSNENQVICNNSNNSSNSNNSKNNNIDNNNNKTGENKNNNMNNSMNNMIENI